MKNILYYFSLLAVFGSFLGILYFYYLLYAPIQILEIQNMKMQKEVYTPGEDLVYTLKYCRYTEYRGSLGRSLMKDDIIVLQFPNVFTTGGIGCREEVFRSIAVPKELKSGTYSLDFLYTFRVNPLRIIDYRYEGPDFEVKGEGNENF